MAESVFSFGETNKKIEELSAHLENLESLTVTLGTGVSLASWGSLNAYKIGRLMIVVGVGVKFASASGTLCTISGVKASRYFAGTGYVEGSNSKVFFVTMSASGSANEVKFEGVANLNNNGYFEFAVFVD